MERNARVICSLHSAYAAPGYESERSVRCAHEITTITAWPHFVVLSHYGE
jgi:hypothetical protein